MPAPPGRPRLRRFVAGLFILIVTAGACAADTLEIPLGPDGVPDPVLVLGSEIYSDKCASCHGNSGRGDRGPKISDRSTVAKYPDVLDQIAFVETGKGGGRSGPAFKYPAAAVEVVVALKRCGLWPPKAGRKARS